MKKTILTICGALTLFVYVACNSNSTNSSQEKSDSNSTASNSKSKTSDDALIGKWVSTETTNLTLTLNDTGMGSQVDQTGNQKIIWTTNKNQLCLQIIGGLETCGEYVVNGDELKWTAMGMTLSFKK